MLEVGRPVDSKYPINSPFGGEPRELIIDGKKIKQTRPHQGIDFKCPTGTKIAAVAPGKILKVGLQDDSDSKVGLGLRVIQQFEFENEQYICCYGHLSKLYVKENDLVEYLQYVGESGNSGNSEGPHLHVQFRKLDTSNWIDANFV